MVCLGYMRGSPLNVQDKGAGCPLPPLYPIQPQVNRWLFKNLRMVLLPRVCERLTVNA